MLYFHKTMIISVFRSALLRKSYIYLPLLKPTKLKNDNSCNVPISCTIYVKFISKAQQPNEKLRLFMWSVTVSEKRNNIEIGRYMNHLLSDFYKDCYLSTCIICQCMVENVDIFEYAYVLKIIKKFSNANLLLKIVDWFSYSFFK